jgi:hypothetical protein
MGAVTGTPRTPSQPREHSSLPPSLLSVSSRSPGSCVRGAVLSYAQCPRIIPQNNEGRLARQSPTLHQQSTSSAPGLVRPHENTRTTADRRNGLERLETAHPAEPANLNAINQTGWMFFYILAYRNQPCSSCVLRGESAHIAGSAVKAYFSMNDMQTRSLCAIKEQMASLSPAMMRELSSIPDVFPLFTKDLLFWPAMSTQPLKSLAFGIPYPFSRPISCSVAHPAPQHRNPRRPTS